MAPDSRPRSRQRWRFLPLARVAFFAWFGLASFDAAWAYVGDSFISIPGSVGHWRGNDHKNWVRVEVSDWTGRIRPLNSGSSDPLAGDKLFFGGPYAAHPGNSGKLVIALGKGNPDLPQLMDMCTKKIVIPELTYAESSDRARPLLEFGQRPPEFPAWWEYKLKNVEFVDCPVLEGAIDQALVLTFKDIEWLNYDPKLPTSHKIVVRPEDLPKIAPAQPTAKKQTKDYLITWIAPATTTTDDQCPVMNAKPSEAEIFRYMSKEEEAAIRAKNGEKGVSYGSESERRGPHRLSVAALPGIVPDPGLHEPQASVAEGLDLDGDDGNGSPPRGVRKHKNFVSPDGRTGVDNQLFRVMGCVPGYRGKKGYRNQTSNARRADGNVTTLIEISGIDDEKNDDSVEVSFIYSMDKPIRDNTGSKFIANYTFRPSDNPNFALYNLRAHGRIVNGVVITDPIPAFNANLGQDPLLELFKARMRFEPRPDGSVKGYVGGYLNWKSLMDTLASGYSEGLFNFQTPALYYALRRNADGLQNPLTGEYDGISTVYEIETVPAFLTPAPLKPVTVAQDNTAARKTQ
jgi:hypothetical protein